jgi:uncharacterized protein (TIGR03086 family)
MLDLELATGALADVVSGVRDDQLTMPTPCTEACLGDLIDHVRGLSIAFSAAATKSPLDSAGQGPSADASRLGTDWRTRVPEGLETLAGAWRNEAAWVGMTRAGGVDLPAEIAGVIALDEVIIHGWDIAVASGQSLRHDPRLVEAAFEFVRASVEQNPGGPGIFGPAVPVPHDATLIDRLIGLAGRDPGWRPVGARD